LKVPSPLRLMCRHGMPSQLVGGTAGGTLKTRSRHPFIFIISVLCHMRKYCNHSISVILFENGTCMNFGCHEKLNAKLIISIYLSPSFVRPSPILLGTFRARVYPHWPRRHRTTRHIRCLRLLSSNDNATRAWMSSKALQHDRKIAHNLLDKLCSLVQTRIL